MNYGVVLAQKGDFENAFKYLEKARRVLSPSYGLIEVNLGVITGKLNRDREAEQHFQRALELSRNDSVPHYNYARWLEINARTPEAIEQLRLGIKANPDDLASFYLLLEINGKRNSWDTVRGLARYILQRFPSEGNARAYRLMAAMETTEIDHSGAELSRLKTADNFLNLSALYFQAGKFQRAIDAANEAIRLQPNYPEAFNNIASAERALENWDRAAEAARQALRLRPGYKMAQENLARASRREQDPAR